MAQRKLEITRKEQRLLTSTIVSALGNESQALSEAHHPEERQKIRRRIDELHDLFDKVQKV